MKCVYTAAAEQEMLNFKNDQIKKLEQYISESKLIYGDDVIEITATDIREASKNFKILYENKNNTISSDLITTIYIFIGVFMIVGSFLYQDIIHILKENRIQGTLLMMGTSMVTIGVFAKHFFITRKKRFLQNEQRLIRERELNGFYKSTTNEIS